jgi:NADPH-dependent 2,4-dienoyl-CoA reductase/sulfur reductase-like enzyme
MFDPHGCNVNLAAAIKAAVRIPVVAVGGFNAPEQIEDALASGACDFVALGRQQFADPAFVNKAMTGRADEIAPCLRCSCFNPLLPDPEKRDMPELWSCAVNPQSGRALRWRSAPRPIHTRKVLVIGGGVAGMYAAITAADRGHDVTLAEKSDKLGGLLWFTNVDEHKESLKRFRDSLAVRCERAGVDVRFNTEATADLVKQIAPDAVICAVGSLANVPKIDGIEYAIHALDLYADPARVGKRVVMIGGGLIGAETGLWLADHGHEVIILEMREDVAIDANDSHRRALIPRMRGKLKWEVNVTVTAIDANGVSFSDKDGRTHFLEADTVVYAVGQHADKGTVESLKDSCDRFVAIGDCVQARQVKQATYEGFCAAMDIL